MKVLRFIVPPQVFVVFVTLTLGSLAIGVTLVSWIVAVCIGFVRHNALSTLLQFPREYVFIAKTAPWFDEVDKTIWNWGAVLALLGGVSGTYLGIRLSRYLVVKKFGWMTDEEAEAMLKRDPGW